MDEKKRKNIKKEQESQKNNSLQNICGGQNAWAFKLKAVDFN